MYIHAGINDNEHGETAICMYFMHHADTTRNKS